MIVNEIREGDVAILALAGRLDSTSSPGVEGRLTDTVRQSRAVVVDLADLDYISSAGLRVLLKAAKEAKAARARLAFAALRPAVKEVLDISGFSSILATYPSRAAAVSGVA